MVMTVVLPGSRRFAGLLFLLIVPLMLYQSFEVGWSVSYQEMTEKRAAHIAQALDHFRAREGHYPESLDALTPRDLLFIQRPVILAGENWCYQGGGDYYLLSAFYREYFSSPVSLRVYESAGEPPAGPLVCEDRLAAMKKKYYSPMEDPNAMRPPVPTPVPDIDVGIPKTEIQPLLNGAVALAGSWSPAGSYFVFATQDTGLTLHFLNGKTGEVCSADSKFSGADSLRDRYVWLRDGRLLYLDTSGELVTLIPCQLGEEQLTDRYPETFTQVGTYTQDASRILLQSENAYWILDGATFEVKPIPEVAPTPYEVHWDRSVWLPDNRHLVIAHLNGRSGSNAGSTLYLIDGETGQVEKSLTLKGDFGQSAPWVDSLSDHEIILNGIGNLFIVDFDADPPKMTNVLADIFGLDLRYPDDMSASGSLIDHENGGYYLFVRANHPHNQATYLYDSHTKQTYIYNHEHDTLLLFPDGKFVELPKQETVPTYQDVYDVVKVDEPQTVQPQLKFTGHTPRDYPDLNLVYLAQSGQFAAASAHGVSLVSLSDGKLEKYWALTGEGYSPWLTAAPDGSALIAVKDFGGLYYIPLSTGQ